MISQWRNKTSTSEDEAQHSSKLVGGGALEELRHPNHEEQRC